MVDFNKLTECFTGLVGFRNGNRTGVESFSGSQTGSTSGIYYTDEPGVTQSLMHFAKSKDYATLADYADQVNKDAIREVMNDYVSSHSELTDSRTVMKSVNPVNQIVRMQDQVAKNGRFVFVRLDLTPSDTLIANIVRLGVQFNTLNNGLKFYLFETSQYEAIAEYELTGHTKTMSLQWFDVNLKCPYKSTTGGTNQSYLFGYFENDLQGNALNTKVYDACCGNQGWVNDYRKYVWITGGVVENSRLNSTYLPDSNYLGQTDQSFGIHVSVNVTCDISDIICDNTMVFAKAIQKRGAMRVYRDFMNTTNVSREAELSRDQAATNYAMVEADYKRYMKNLTINFTDIDGICQPCSKRVIKSVQLL